MNYLADGGSSITGWDVLDDVIGAIVILVFFYFIFKD